MLMTGDDAQARLARETLRLGHDRSDLAGLGTDVGQRAAVEFAKRGTIETKALTRRFGRSRKAPGTAAGVITSMLWAGP